MEPVVRVTVNVTDVDDLKSPAGEESALQHALDLAKVPGAARSARTVDLTPSAAVDLMALAYRSAGTAWEPYIRALQDPDSALSAWSGHLEGASGSIVIELDGRGRVKSIDGLVVDGLVGGFGMEWDEQRGLMPLAPEIPAC